MAKMRNSLCHCKSGKKYKNCCGKNKNSQNKFVELKADEKSPEMKHIIERNMANELVRQQQQGLGKPIISTKFQGFQMIAVGSTIHYSSTWKTVPDFLVDYLKKIFGLDWGNKELKKPFNERHPILQWYEKCCQHDKKYLDGSGEVKSVPAIGATYCYLGLAYGLYLLDHNAELQKIYVNRLKNVGTFQGAYYELIVASCLIRAGFELELEDETDENSKHCEFSARSKKTRKKYWVEAKMRSEINVLGKTEKDGTKPKDPTIKLTDHIKAALKKPAEDERLIFVDVNSDFEASNTQPSWLEKACKKLDQREKDQPNQVAYVFVTNMSFHRHLDDQLKGNTILAHGLGIPDFAKPGYYALRELYFQKKKHVDVYDIMESFNRYPQIPITFDGSLPSETLKNNKLPKVGEKYFFEGANKEGTITCTLVNEDKKTIYYGTSIGLIVEHPISDDQLADYKNHPDTFFGAVQPQGKKTEDPYDIFESMMNIYKNTPKEKLLEFTKDHPDHDKLKLLSHEDLVITCCERWVYSFLQNQKSKE